MKLSRIKASKGKTLSVQDLSEKAPSKGLAKKNKLDRTTIEALIDEKSVIDERIKALNERKAVLSDRIKEIAETNGVKDNNGSYNFKFAYNDEEYMFCKNARTTRKFNQEKALQFFKSKKKNLLSAVLEKVEVINENKIQTLILEEKLEPKDLKEFFDESVSYAGLLNKVKEEEAPREEPSKVVQTTRDNPSKRRLKR